MASSREGSHWGCGCVGMSAVCVCVRVCVCSFLFVLSFSCGDSTDQTQAIYTALAAGAVVMLLISFGVAALSPLTLALAVTSLLVLQQLALAGVDGAASSPYYQEQLSTAFTWLNLVRR